MMFPFFCFASDKKIFTEEDLNKYRGTEDQISSESSNILPSDDLGKTFKSQLDEYNREIKTSKSMVDFHMSKHKEMVDKKYFGIASEQMREAEKYLNRLDKAKEKRAALKIKVLEHDNQLPSWWQED